jgi:ribosomal protein S18 acetylase RimI-like enzyme
MPDCLADLPVTALDVARPECREGLLVLWRRAYRVEADLVGIDDFPPLRVSLDDLESRPGAFYAIVQKQRPVGAIEVEEISADARRISSLVVDPDWFRRGIGRRLVKFVLESAPARVQVSTSTANAPAVMLYRSMGFRQTETSTRLEGIELSSFEYCGRCEVGQTSPPTRARARQDCAIRKACRPRPDIVGVPAACRMTRAEVAAPKGARHVTK